LDLRERQWSVAGEWFIMRNVLHPSPRFIRVIKARSVIWTVHVTLMGEVRNAYKILVGKHGEKIPLEGPRSRWEGSRMW
jgi:hypothetical protein